jgi:predicted nuclease with RNAse H fold
MITLGVDLSADDRKTAACAIIWSDDGTGEASAPEFGLTNEDLRQRIEEADWSGIDAPFSWPAPYQLALANHVRDGGWPEDWRDTRYQLRATDSFVAACARRPLSVSTDRIGVTAMRCARLLQEIGEDRSHRIDLVGGDRIVEVYPGAALAAWGGSQAGLDPAGYKTGPKAKEARERIVQTLEALDWLVLSTDVQARCIERDHDLDALLAGLVTRAAERGLTRPPETEEQRELSKSEGWIHVPMEGGLRALRQPHGSSWIGSS